MISHMPADYLSRQHMSIICTYSHMDFSASALSKLYPDTMEKDFNACVENKRYFRYWYFLGIIIIHSEGPTSPALALQLYPETM